ncbi:MAG: proline--tRNA ligase [Nanoarchaeota archaeon]|nr:proline--tRNA ligase [Nanoarchaeota archaeon]MBU0963043.1 proline--tRNA ligase [Nanoarchaeota archaeon]
MSKEEGITVKKEQDFSEWYTQVVQKAELADIRFGIQGFIVHRPWGFFIIKKIYEYFEREIEKDGHVAFLFPSVVKEEYLKKEKEHAGFTPEVFWISEAGDKKLEERFALRPTGEAQIYPIYSLWFRSYKDLPFKGYQSRISSFRNEMTTRPFLRGREFLFFESHDVFNTHEEVLKQVEKDLEICDKVLKEDIKIPFLFFKRPQWDKFKGAVDSFTPETLMPDGKKTQLASTHDLGQRFSKAYDIKVKNKDEKDEYVWQSCFGPGIWRTMASIIGIHGDDNGLVLPFDMAPIQIIIIPILFSNKDNKAVIKKCKDIESKLKNYRVKIDLTENTTGYKYNYWELHGVPLRLEIGPKEVKENKITIALRTGSKFSIKLNDLTKEIEKNAKLLDKKIEEKASTYFKDRIKETNSYNELKKILKDHKGFVKVPFCSMDWDGEKCADKLKEETAANVSGTLYPTEDKIKDKKCIICGKKAKHLVYVAKSY